VTTVLLKGYPAPFDQAINPNNKILYLLQAILTAMVDLVFGRGVTDIVRVIPLYFSIFEKYVGTYFYVLVRRTNPFQFVVYSTNAPTAVFLGFYYHLLPMVI
jgi:hypothetical protein